MLHQWFLKYCLGPRVEQSSPGLPLVQASPLSTLVRDADSSAKSWWSDCSALSSPTSSSWMASTMASHEPLQACFSRLFPKLDRDMHTLWGRTFILVNHLVVVVWIVGDLEHAIGFLFIFDRRFLHVHIYRVLSIPYVPYRKTNS
jgi:hypothetical protein